MSIRVLQCPGCSQPVNVPAHLTNVRCPSCGTVWNSAITKPSPSPGKGHGGERNSSAESMEEGEAPDQDETSKGTNHLLVLGSLAGAFFGFLAMFGLVVILIQNNRPDPPPEVSFEEQTNKPMVPEPYRVVNLPEEQRKRIYTDYRRVARTTTEVPIMMPSSKARSRVEDTLQGIQDRELRRFAALHNVDLADIQEIIKEGDAQVWDSSPRSHAKRGGKRNYSDEMSEGWKKNQHVR